MPCSVRYKIHKKSVDKKKKDKKLNKKNPSFTRPKKDPGIPSMYPFKEKLLNQIEQVKKQKQDEKLNQKLANKKKQLEEAYSKAGSISELAENAAIRGEAYDLNEQTKPVDDGYYQGMEVEGVATGNKDNSRRAYYREFVKVVEISDVILQVLDARDPLGTRSKQIEQLICEKYSKKLVLLLNKTDLVPRDNLVQWLAYLRKERPTVLFKANTQQQRSNLGQNNSSSSSVGGTSTECFGGESLLQLLKNYCRNSNLKTAITVGIIGFPNVGKSSVINSLKRARVCAVGPTPGFTKAIQLVNLDKTIRLLDSPGVVFNFGNTGSKKSEAELNEICLRNIVKVELLNNPTGPAEVVINRCNSSNLASMYDVLPFSSPREFLVQLAKKYGRFRRGGIPDLDSAARIILNDWNVGKIPYYTTVPGSKQSAASAALAQAKKVENSAIVSGWSKEFDLDSLANMDTQVLESNDTLNKSLNIKSNKVIAVSEGRELDLNNYTLEKSTSKNLDDGNVSDSNDSDASIELDEDAEISDSEMSVQDIEIDEEPEDDENVVVNIKTPAAATVRTRTKNKLAEEQLEATAQLNSQTNKNLKLAAKKSAKKQKRKLATLSNDDDSMAVDENAPYDFNTYFKQDNNQNVDDSSDEDL
ncbi:Guanine nucleotide-binding protein-like 3-like protein [Smittium culicis]|uniref:Guanine nucleotide-binding protein-like 3-like protein n=2 Tax=Smittium culicis TaxID=133412 RepID=A0A1R1YSG2_9FUNG|nr:Guanine nucleotide-binding protein-like 3-like protein [Smittium culicis]